MADLVGRKRADIPYIGYVVADFQVQGVTVPERGPLSSETNAWVPTKPC